MWFYRRISDECTEKKRCKIEMTMLVKLDDGLPAEYKISILWRSVPVESTDKPS